MDTTERLHGHAAFSLATATFGDSVFVVDLDGGELGLNVVVRLCVTGLAIDSVAACDGLVWRAATDSEVELASAWVDANESELHRLWAIDADNWRTESDRSPRVAGVVRSVEVFCAFFARWTDGADGVCWLRNLRRHVVCGELRSLAGLMLSDRERQVV